ncbi:hypothetical protein P2318_02905 [Myxococcaceae bacterium GXIMD 01537]
MDESTPRDPRDRTPRSYATEPPRPIDQIADPGHIPLGSEVNHIQPKHNTFLVSTLTMVFTSLITFYMPFFNGIVGGAFGGFHAREMGRALWAALVSSLVVPAILLLAYGFDQPDFLRFFSGLGFDGWFILHVIGTCIGAVFGAACRPLADEPVNIVRAEQEHSA